MTATTITPEQRAAVEAALMSPQLHLTIGVGLADGGPLAGERCTISEIQLVLTGVLRDGPHPCISNLIRMWVISIQDAMPDTIRNSPAWRAAAVGIAGSAATPAVEAARAAMVMEWMWGILGDPAVLAAADRHGFRSAWDRMVSERTVAAIAAAEESAYYYAHAARAATFAAARAASFAASATRRPADAADAADAASAAALAAITAATDAAAAAYAARAATFAADAATDAATDAASVAADAALAVATADAAALWERADPAGLLARLVTA